jgi:hypothetical protein
MKQKAIIAKSSSQPNFDRLQILEKLKINYKDVPLASQINKSKPSFFIP